jgi:hypothetical protein
LSIAGPIVGRLPWQFNVHTGDPVSSHILTGRYADDDAAAADPHPNDYRHTDPIIYP